MGATRGRRGEARARARTLTWSLSPVFLGWERHAFAAALRAALSGRRAGMPLMESNMADVGFPRVRRRWSAPAPTRTAAVNFNPRGTVASMHEGRAVGRRRLRDRCRAGTSACRSGGNVRPETRFSRFRARARLLTRRSWSSAPTGGTMIPASSPPTATRGSARVPPSNSEPGETRESRDASPGRGARVYPRVGVASPAHARESLVASVSSF